MEKNEVQKSLPKEAPGVKYWEVEYKYLLRNIITVDLAVSTGQFGTFFGGLVRITAGGTELTIHPGYAWDGPSGPAVDTPAFMLPSLVHDVLYQMIREGLINRSYKKYADKEMRRLAKETGMWAPRRWWTYTAVKVFGGRHASE